MARYERHQGPVWRLKGLSATEDPRCPGGKAAVLALVRSMAVALARHDIRANSLVPGWTLTDLTAAGYEHDRFREATIGRTPVRRWGRPEDFRAVAAFLCDRRQQFHTGDEVTIDGGYTVF